MEMSREMKKLPNVQRRLGVDFHVLDCDSGEKGGVKGGFRPRMQTREGRCRGGERRRGLGTESCGPRMWWEMRELPKLQRHMGVGVFATVCDSGERGGV